MRCLYERPTRMETTLKNSVCPRCACCSVKDRSSGLRVSDLYSLKVASCDNLKALGSEVDEATRQRISGEIEQRWQEAGWLAHCIAQFGNLTVEELSRARPRHIVGHQFYRESVEEGSRLALELLLYLSQSSSMRS